MRSPIRHIGDRTHAVAYRVSGEDDLARKWLGTRRLGKTQRQRIGLPGKEEISPTQHRIGIVEDARHAPEAAGNEGRHRRIAPERHHHVRLDAAQLAPGDQCPHPELCRRP